MQFARLISRRQRDAGPAGRFTRTGLALLLAALAIEFADELVDGAKSAAMPLIRHDLALSYVQIGLLAAVPLILGSLLELPLGVVSGSGRRRRRTILAGGVIFIAAVLAAGLAHSFWVLLAAFVVFFPASGAFVSLTQAELMDAEPGRRAQQMARWTFAGAVGGVGGPLLVAAVLAAGGTWRLSFIVIGGLSGLALLGMGLAGGKMAAGWSAARRGPADLAAAGPEAGTGAGAGNDDDESDDEDSWPGWSEAAIIIRGSGVLRVLLLLQVSDLMLDVLTTFLALYLVEAVHASPSVAALGVAVRLGTGVVGYGGLVRVLERFDSQRVLRASVGLTAVLFPAFLLVPGLWPKLVALAALTLASSPWYPVLQAEMYGRLPGRSGLAVSLSSAAGLAGGLGPLAVGLLAQHLGLSWAMAALCAAPLVMLAVPARRRRRQ
jgi:FSR family fosmidomycin resistance protein-like MFS transporter